MTLGADLMIGCSPYPRMASRKKDEDSQKEIPKYLPGSVHEVEEGSDDA